MVRPRRPRLIGRFALAGALLLAVTAQTAAPRVRIGGTPAEPYLEASYAQESGLFQKAGPQRLDNELARWNADALAAK